MPGKIFVVTEEKGGHTLVDELEVAQMTGYDEDLYASTGFFRVGDADVFVFERGY